MSERTLTLTLDAAAIERLRAALAEGRFEWRDVAHAHFSARGEGVAVTAYRSGKVVIQGPGVSQFRERYLEAVPAPVDPDFTERVAGADETGKGDYFGPLVAATVALGPAEMPLFDELPLADSKTLSDRACAERAAIIRASLPHEVVSIGPKRYNQLYARFGNVNHLLAWAHGRAIEKVLERAPVSTVVIDRFADEETIRRGLSEKGLAARLVARVRGESHPAVAAASILARDAFVRALSSLSARFGITLPKGASAAVEAAARQLVRQRGPEALGDAAKLHFRTTSRVLGPDAPAS